MLSVHNDAWDFSFQYAGDELRQLPVAQDGGGAELLYVDLIEDLAGGGQRLDEDGLFVGDGIGDFVKILRGKREIFGEGAVMIDDAEDGAASAVRFQAAQTEFADRFVAVGGTGDVDVAGDAAADPAGLLLLECRGGVTAVADFGHFADELVARDAAEVVVAAQDFNVGVADASEANFDQGPVGKEFWEGFFDGD